MTPLYHGAGRGWNWGKSPQSLLIYCNRETRIERSAGPHTNRSTTKTLQKLLQFRKKIHTTAAYKDEVREDVLATIRQCDFKDC